MTDDRQDFATPFFTCPQVKEWNDERNASYGYNYQFLGNSRMRNGQFHNFPVRLSKLQTMSGTVMSADGMGTAAAYSAAERTPYENDGRTQSAYGNESYVLDPPRLTLRSDVCEDAPTRRRSGPHARHGNRTNYVFVDSHAGTMRDTDLGYVTIDDGVFVDQQTVAVMPTNGAFSGTGADEDPPALP